MLPDNAPPLSAEEGVHNESGAESVVFPLLPEAGERWASAGFPEEVVGGSCTGVFLDQLPCEPPCEALNAAACAWPESHHGFRNDGNECYMISAIQLLSGKHIWHGLYI